MKPNHPPEAFFHFIWKHRMLAPGLKTTGGESINILHPGVHNTDAGPDFLFARIRINQTIWAGSVEIHVKASDWYRHNHEKDRSYTNVILHVVVENDGIVRDSNGRKLQTMCIANSYDQAILMRYKQINENLLWVPCMNLIGSVSNIEIISRINALAVERIKDKSAGISLELHRCNMDWEECCFRLIARQFGAKINTDSFEMLARTLSVRTLMKYHKNLFQLEALLFGQSGLLNRKLHGSYPNALKREHVYLSHKHGIKPMPGYLWNFLRLRPASFPSLRIAHLAKIYEQHQSVFQEILEMDDINSLMRFFSVEASVYWDNHYLFGKKGKTKKKKFGQQGIQLLLINAIIPLIHYYGMQMNKPGLCDKAILFLETLPPENNAVIRRWKSAGVNATNSLETQGLIQLKNTRCQNKLCLDCNIAYQILKKKRGKDD